VQQEKSAIDKVEALTRQPGVACVSIEKVYICQTGVSADCGSLIELRRVDIDSGNASLRADDLGKHSGYGADAATEVRDMHSGLQPSPRQQAPPVGRIDVVKDEQAAHSRGARGKRVFAPAGSIVVRTYG